MHLASGMTLPTLLTIVATALFLILERVFPGRPLPHAPGWYGRALGINFAQLAITLTTGKLWQQLFGGDSILRIADWQRPIAEGFVG